MMKVSDPIIFGHAVRAFFPGFRAARRAGDPNDGGSGDAAGGTEIDRQPRTDRPALAMVDSDRGITNLHVPSDVIIDASMPAAIRASGQMWNAAGEQQDTKFVIPDHSMRRCTPRPSTTAASTARSTRRRWARPRTSG